MEMLADDEGLGGKVGVSFKQLVLFVLFYIFKLTTLIFYIFYNNSLDIIAVLHDTTLEIATIRQA